MVAPDIELQRLGFVDMGSNTARLVVFEYQPGVWFQVIDSIREPVRLAEGFAETGELSTSAIDRAIAALKLFADFGQATQLPPITVFCTSAVREASNREQFLSQVEALGLPYQILTGKDEAQRGSLAVVNSLDVSDAWVIDLGGGSAQLSRVRDRTFVEGDAYPLGAVRTTEQFFEASINPASVADLEQFVCRQLATQLAKIAEGEDPIAVMGGSIRSLALAAQATERYPFPLLHGYSLSLAQLEQVTERLLTRTLAQRKRMAGIVADRADILPAAAIVFRTILRESKRAHLTISGTGVREGIFFTRFLPEPHLLHALRSFAVSNLRRESSPRGHPAQVRRLALALFDGLRPLHRLDTGTRELLATAADLHDVGTRISFHRRHRHASYLVNAAPLPGFSHREQAFISTLVRYHRSGRPSFGAFQRLFSASDEQALLYTATCLRLAIQFERSRASRIADLRVKLGEPVEIEVYALAEPTVELWEAGKHANLFHTAFGHSVRFRFKPLKDSA